MDAGLIERLAARCADPVVYGENDCAHFAGDFLREATGDDLLGEWRGIDGREDMQRRAWSFAGCSGPAGSV